MTSLDITKKSMYYAELSRLIVNLLVTRLITCSVRNLNKFIDKSLANFSFADYYRDHDGKQERGLISYDLTSSGREFNNCLSTFKKTISSHVLDAYDIQRADAKGIYIIRKVVQALYNSPQQLPDECLIDYYTTTKGEEYAYVVDRVIKEGVGGIRKECISEILLAHNLSNNNQSLDAQYKLIVLLRTICNFIAGMTDHSLQVFYQDLYG